MPYYVHIVHMVTESIATTRAQISSLLKQVQAGETIVVLDHGMPVARIEPVSSFHEEGYGLMSKKLAKAGDLLPRKTVLDATFFDLPMTADQDGSVRSALIAERREGR